MNTVIIDLEFTRLNPKCTDERKICKYEVIEIGAVKLNSQQEVISRFNTLVKPTYSEIQDKVTALTHISDAMVQTAPSFTKALSDFIYWVGEEDSIIYSWSDTDRIQLEQESTLKGCKTEQLERLLGNWVDLQLLVGNLFGIKQQLSLANALRGTGIIYVGNEHSALDDAENTAKLYKLTKDEKKFKESAASVLELFAPKETLTYSLKGLFENIKIA